MLRGAAIPLIGTSVTTLIQRTTPQELLGRTLANVYGGVEVAAALGYLCGGPLLDATSPRATFVVIGLGGLAGTIVCATLLRCADGSAARRRPT